MLSALVVEKASQDVHIANSSEKAIGISNTDNENGKLFYNYILLSQEQKLSAELKTGRMEMHIG